MHFTSVLAPQTLPGVAAHRRTAASRFSSPQHEYAPAQWLGCRRTPDSSEGASAPTTSGSRLT